MSSNTARRLLPKITDITINLNLNLRFPRYHIRSSNRAIPAVRIHTSLSV